MPYSKRKQRFKTIQGNKKYKQIRIIFMPKCYACNTGNVVTDDPNRTITVNRLK